MPGLRLRPGESRKCHRPRPDPNPHPKAETEASRLQLQASRLSATRRRCRRLRDRPLLRFRVVVMCDETGKPTGRRRRLASGDYERTIASRLTLEAYRAASGGPGSFNRRLDYPKTGWR